jgi:DNA-binding IclR family transcriptional regulator
MTKRIGLNQSKVVDMIGLLVRAPRTVAELSELTGMDRTRIYPWLRLMVEERLLRRKIVNGKNWHYVYHWSPLQ